MASILVTGFAPFDGRQENSSRVAALSLSDRHGEMAVATRELSVEWDAPKRELLALCDEFSPEVIVAMGEGRVGWFDIETVALRERKERRDNAGLLPSGPGPWPDGPASREASIRAPAVKEALTARGYPTRISTSAGGFICEEALYTLESLRLERPHLATTIFVHLPPHGTALTVGGVERSCDEALLAAFARDLLDAVIDEHLSTISCGGDE